MFTYVAYTSINVAEFKYGLIVTLGDIAIKSIIIL